MEDKDYIKLTLMDVNGREAVEVDVLASKTTLTSMIYSAMCNNKFFSDCVISASKQYYLHVIQHDAKARLN
jgi:aspartate/glutamate racemase